MAKKFISYNGRIVSDNLSLKLLGQDVSPQPTPPSDFTNCKSLVFDGTDDFVNIGTTSLGITNAISISAWVKIPTTNTGGASPNIQQIICEDATSGSNRNWALNWRGGTNNNWQWVIWNTNGSVTVVTSSGLTPNDNQWHHLFATYDGTSNANGLKLYVDGGTPFTATASSTGIRSTSSVEPSIGSLTNGSSWFFEGNIDEVAVWNSDQSTNASTIYNSGVPNDLSTLNPLSWWRMGDGDTFPTLTDNGSGGNDGTMTNMSSDSIVYDVPLFNTKSILFDGADDYVDMGNILDFTNTDAFSISCWFKRTRTGVSEFLVSKQDSTSNSRGYTLLIPFDDNKVTVVIRNNTATSGRLIVDCATVITDTNWHNIIMTYDGSSNVSGINLYLDGNNDTGVTSGTLSATISNTASFQIGAKNAANEFSGNIDEVVIWDSELSASDVTAIYNSGVPNNISSLSPLSWWRMGDGDTFPTLIDRGSGGNNGTMTNMVSTSIVDDVPLYSNKSFEFDGVDDYISCGDNDNLSFGNGTTDSPFSVSAWVKMDNIAKFRAVGKYGASNIEYVLATGGDNKLIFNCYDNSEGSRIGRKYFTPMNSYQGQWCHIVGTYNGNSSSSGLKIYINGTRVDDTDSNLGTYVAMENTIQPLYIGKLTTSYSDGNIDEVSIFNTELSASDVTAIYNNGVPNDISCLSPLSWWRMGEDATFDGTNWSLVDNGSGGNDGTSQNMGLSSISNDVPPT